MRIVRFHLEPWQKGGSTASGLSSPSSMSSLMPLSDSVLRRQRAPSDDELSNIDTNLFEKRSQSSTSRHSSYSKRRMTRTVKRLTVLCSDILARHVNVDYFISTLRFMNTFVFLDGNIGKGGGVLVGIDWRWSAVFTPIGKIS